MKTSLGSQFIGHFSLALLLTVPTWACAEKPIKTTLCAIEGNPAKFDRKLVQFEAFYESDGFEHSILVDEAKCKWGIAAHFPEKLAGEDDLERALFMDHPGTRDKVSPHSIRLSTASHLLHAGVDINTIRAWLGHVSLETTNIYAETNLEMKAKALAMCEIEERKSKRRWREDPGLMTFLRSL